MQLTFGERNWVIFNNESDFFESLGYLCNNARGVYISSETSSNRWGAELRIWIENANNMPSALRNADSEGLGNYERRINCNDYIYFIMSNFNITAGTGQNYNTVLNIINTHPVYSNYIQDFIRGYNIPL